MKTRIPKAFAVMKCPNSWTKMMTPSTTMKAPTVCRKPMSCLNLGLGEDARGSAAAQDQTASLTSPGIRFEHVVEVAERRRLVVVHDLGNRLRDGHEGNAP